MTDRVFNTGPEWLDWLAAVLGTRQWVVAKRMSVRLTDKGYEVCITPRTYALLEAGFQEQADSEFDHWHPASGYRAESGRSLWRVVRCRKDNPPRFEELTGPSGKLVLLATYEAARTRSIKANCSEFANPPEEADGTQAAWLQAYAGGR